MKHRFLTLIGVFALGSASLAMAQDYDDIYFDASSSRKVAPQYSTTASTASSGRVAKAQPRRYQIVKGESSTTRNEDEYNRRGVNSSTPYGTDTAAYNEEQNSFSNTQRIQRFYNPNVVDGSGDQELITLYYDTAPTVNLVIGSYWGPSMGWGYYAWNDPWYSNWYGPYYYNDWYMGINRLWGWRGGLYPGWYCGWSSWYDPWYARWYGPDWFDYGWGHSYWAHSYYRYDSRSAGGRRPQGGYANAGSTTRPGYASSTGMGRRPGSYTTSHGINSGGRNYGNSIASGNMGSRSVNLSGTHRSAYNVPAQRYNSSTSMGRRPSATVSEPSPRIYNAPSRSYSSSRSSYTPSYTPSVSTGRSSYGNTHTGGGGFSGGGGHRR